MTTAPGAFCPAGLRRSEHDEFEYFFDNLKGHIDRISKWRCPKSHTIAASITENDKGIPATARVDGRTIYRMYKKK